MVFTGGQPASRNHAGQARSAQCGLPFLGSLFVFSGGQIPGALGLAAAVEPVAEAENRMLPKHARTGVTHDGLDFVAAAALTTMDRAVRASGFLRAEAAAFEALLSVILKFLALRTNPIRRPMMAVAEAA